MFKIAACPSKPWRSGAKSIVLVLSRLALVLTILFTIHYLLFTGSAHAAPGPPDPKPCASPLVTWNHLTDNYITEENGEPPADLIVTVQGSGSAGQTVTLSVDKTFTVDFSKLQAIFGATNSNYLEGKFQDEKHQQDNLLALKSSDFNKYHGPGQKTAPKLIVDDLKVNYVEYVYNKPTLPEAASRYADINGQDPKTIYDLVNDFGLPQPPKPTDDRTTWLNTWGKYWEKIPTAYSEFYTGFLEFRYAAGEREFELIKTKGNQCPIPVRSIEFIMPEFWRTTSISDQLNQIVVPCAAQSWRHGNTEDEDKCGAKAQVASAAGSEKSNILSKAVKFCKDLINNASNGVGKKLKEAVKISLNLVNPIKNAFADTEPSPSPALCIKQLTPGKQGNAPYCALPEFNSEGRPQLGPGDSCINKVSAAKLDKENPRVECTFRINFTIEHEISLTDPFWNSCWEMGDDTYTCSTKVRIWPVFRIPYLSEIWNNTLYSNEDETGVGSNQESGRPGIYSVFTPQAIYSQLFENGGLITKEEFEVLSKECIKSDDLNSEACKALFDLYDELVRKFPELDTGCIDAATNPSKLVACFGPFWPKLPSKNLPGEVPEGNVQGASTEEIKERFIGATDCSKFFVRDISLKPKALQEAIGINTQECNLVAAALPETVGRPSASPQPNGNGLVYYIRYGDTSILPSSSQDEFRNLAILAGWIPNNIDARCPGGITCYQYVIQQSIARGISPAFSITIWWEEGGFGGAGANSEFGCFPGGDTSQVLSFLESFNCFLNFTAREHPYDPSNPQSSFIEWVTFFCGPSAVPICSNNPGFINRLESIYNTVAPGEIVYVPT